MTLAQRMIVMNAGRAEQIGTPAEVYGHPATTFVASFIGSPPMNLLRGRVDADGTGFVLGTGLSIALPAAATQRIGRDVLLGVRPEHLVLAASGLPLIVEMVEVLGADMLVHGKVGDDSVIVRLPDGAHPSFGEQIHCVFEAARLHWFDPSTGMPDCRLTRQRPNERALAAPGDELLAALPGSRHSREADRARLQ